MNINEAAISLFNHTAQNEHCGSSLADISSLELKYFDDQT